MTATGDFLNQVVPTLVRLARRPGGLLLTAAGLGVGVFGALGLLAGLTGTGGGAWVPLVLALVLAVPVLVLAVRRERLQRQTRDLHVRTVHQPSRDVVVVEPGAVPDPVQAEMDALSAAMAENAVRTARFLPRVEAAQRAALAAAGGPVRAPYLKDDLRVTLVALLGTLAAVPLSAIGAVATAAALLAR
ncbi:hypothetical protein [Georgenia thermotolerans]|uniref:Uncharacterized protein n=1 Tax=Georgenia thermotolerans TaxID=527326 RepID=A0A7J5UQ28_9MICO|nr:hypothetical protein [Georgenia thermotolerans]KAE8764515.1 hypothetical protein GB883_08520 [Georgenia thermotolerans]